MSRPRGGKGYVELHQRKTSSPVWIYNYFTYHRSKRVHRSHRLGSIEELPTDEAAEAAAETFRTRMGLGPKPIRYLSRRTRDIKAICSAEQYMAMFQEQQGRCKICGATPRRLCLDHDHTTGMRRGLLCSRCNSGIGLLGDNAEILKSAAAYLEKSALLAARPTLETVTEQQC